MSDEFYLQDSRTPAEQPAPATAAPSQVKEWHERTDKMDDSSIITALKSEIADLRAALARAEPMLVAINALRKALAEAGIKKNEADRIALSALDATSEFADATPTKGREDV